MQDKEKLKKLLDILEELLKIEGNEWLIDAILKKIKQANDFYADFKIEKIKQELIRDFIKMEHERRRDDFENFSLSVYQQIENVTNYIFEQNINNIWDNEKKQCCNPIF